MIGRKHSKAGFDRAAFVRTHMAKQVIASGGKGRIRYSVE
jgi:hypothetical protein